MKASEYQYGESAYKKWVLSPLGLDYDNSFVAWLLLFFIAVTTFLFYYFGGDLPVIILSLYLVTVFILSFIKLDYSFYLFMLCVMLFEQYPIPEFSVFTHDAGLFSNLKEIHYLPFFDAGVVSPMEIHLLSIIGALLVTSGIRKEFSFKPIPVWVPFLFFIGCLFFSVFYGLLGGGEFLVSMWEVRALFYFAIMYLLVPQILESKKQIEILLWIIIAGVAFKALQGIERFIDLGFTTGGLAVLTNHEDAVFIVNLSILLLGFIAFKVSKGQKNWLMMLMPILALGFYVAQRRATYASLIVSIAFFIVLLPAAMRVSFLKYFIPAAIAITIYGFAFWNSDAVIARPVQMIKSGIEKPDKLTNTRDYYSNLYREYENYNLAQTVVNNPVKGTGFGKKYDQPIPLVEIRFSLRDYIPHNQIYWVLVKMGAIGFFAFWFFFNSFVSKGTRLIHKLKDPYLRAVTTMIVIAVINQMVVSFFDLQLTYYRNMLFLGCMMGLLSVIDYIEKNKSLKKKEAVSDGE